MFHSFMHDIMKLFSTPKAPFLNILGETSEDSKNPFLHCGDV